MKGFDFITGNFPWDGGLDKDFLIKCKNQLLTDTGTMAVITSASYLRGRSAQKIRMALSLNGDIEKLWTYPQDIFINPDTQLPIKGVGACLLYTKGRVQGITKLIRYMNGVAYNTTTDFNIADGTMLYIGDEGKELWEKCTAKQTTIPLIPYKDSTNPKIHFSSKLDLNYFGASKPLGTIRGSGMLTGVKLDLDGNTPWIPELKHGDAKNNAAKRFMLEFENQNMAQNASYHVAMRVWGLLIGMTSTISHVTSQSVGSMPFDILTGVYDNPNDYENVYYESKGLSPELIEWVKTVGTEQSGKPTINLKDSNVVSEIERTTDRVKQTGELFTPRHYIDEILDELVTRGMCDKTKRILEPSCGDGNFLLAIIERKLESGMSAVDSLSTTYGCDLMQDNIDLCHKRISEVVGDAQELKDILEHNIVQADFTTGFDFINWCRTLNQDELANDIFGL